MMYEQAAAECRTAEKWDREPLLLFNFVCSRLIRFDRSRGRLLSQRARRFRNLVSFSVLVGRGGIEYFRNNAPFSGKSGKKDRDKSLQ
mmetsp:Transcript_57475/g.171476  ORF Transcript_57475/g.171476 Transcript_57475/m.171476 type:complete len:88 (+) Transcript_57475:197-460(+)